MKFPYEDILNEQRPAPLRPRMSMLDRAAQFAPYAALVGYSDVIEESARLTDQRQELTEEEKQELDYTMDLLRHAADMHPLITVRVFVQDERKEGGKSVHVRSRLKKIDEQRRILILEDKKRIAFADIEEITVESENFF